MSRPSSVDAPALVGKLDDPSTPMSNLDSNITSTLGIANFNWERGENSGGIQHLIEEVAKQTPLAVATIDSYKRSLTYRELNTAADHVSAELRRAGVMRGGMVAVAVSRTCEMVIGILGILKCGAAYVPLDPEYPNDRLEYMLEDSGVSVLLAEQSYADRFRRAGRSVVILNPSLDVSSEELDTQEAEHVDPNDAAYVIYTSGTTGKPKGVVITQGNLLNYVKTLPKELGLTQDDRYLHTASISFSSSVRQLVLPLSLGATVVIASSDKIRDPRQLFELVMNERVTVLDFVPSYWRSCVQTLDPKTLAKSSVRVVLSASEPLKKEVAEAVISKLDPETRIFNMYGQTETTGIVFVSPISHNREINTSVVPIGRPIENANAYILDADLSQVDDGEVGELYVAGPGVGRGYLNRPEMTAAQFLADPFSFETKARMYRTGDLARRLPGGEIEHLGRADDQVKIRGFRIELGEIESVISAFGDIREAVVIAREHNQGDKRLVAYVVSRTKSKVEPAGLRKFLRDRLPEYMVPSAFVQLEGLPLTPNGKLDRKALPPPDKDASADRTGHEAPRTDDEKMLAAIWGEILGIDNIGIRDSFFDLGGNSLLAVEMFIKVEATFKKNIPLATLFGAGTIEKLAAILSQEDWREPEHSLVPIKPGGSWHPFYCMHAVGGNVMFYSDLAKYLHKEQPLYGLQARRLAGRQIGHATIEEMAEFYISEIIENQPEGPYFIGGSSFGGLIAYEIARRFHEEGREVGMLALFDTSTPEYKAKLDPKATKLKMKLHRARQRVQLHVDSLKVLSGSARVEYSLSKAKKGIRKYRRRVQNLFAKAVRKGFTVAGGKSAIPRSYIQLENQLVAARKKFKPKPFPGKATLFRASIQPNGFEHDPMLGWDNYLPEIEVVEVYGHHTSIIAEPYVRGLAELLNTTLEQKHKSL